MRYFDDGDLTEGLQISTKPYPFEIVEGEWHVVWTCLEGTGQLVDYDDPSAQSMMEVNIQRVELKDKRKRNPNDLLVSLAWQQWSLEYSGMPYNTESPATVVHLSANENPEAGDVAKEAILCFSTVLDDQGYPFLRISIQACEAGSGSDDMQLIQLVAKKTDDSGIHMMELTKNEKLRLGFAVDADGAFENGPGAESLLSFESLTKKLAYHTSAQARIMEQVAAVRQRMDEQLREASLAGQRVVSLTPRDHMRLPTRSAPLPSMQPRSSQAPRSSLSKRAQLAEDGGSPATPASKSKRKRKFCRECDQTFAKGQWTKHLKSKKHERSIMGGPPPPAQEGGPEVKHGAAHFTDDDDDENPDEDPSALSSADLTPDSQSSNYRGKRQYCEDCECDVSAHNWSVHTRSNKHILNADGAQAEDRPSPSKRAKIGVSPLEATALSPGPVGVGTRRSAPNTPSSMGHSR